MEVQDHDLLAVVDGQHDALAPVNALPWMDQGRVQGVSLRAFGGEGHGDDGVARRYGHTSQARGPLDGWKCV